MTAKFLRVLFLTGLITCGCVVFILRAQSHSLRIADLYRHASQSTLNDLRCQVDGKSDSCPAIAESKADPPTRAGASTKTGTPERLDYPSGFEQFDTTDPNSPYRQDIYGAKDSEDDAKDKSDSVQGESSTLQRLKAWTPYTSKYTDESHNPVIWQTYKDEPADTSVPYKSWEEQNKPKWSRTFVPQSEVESTMSQLSRDLRFLKETFDALPATVLQLDFLRYVKLFKDGGVYADVDTSCFAPIDSWYAACYMETTTSSRGDRVRSSQPGLIVGVEFDLQGDARLPEVDGHQLALANYVFAANKGHPVLAKMISRIVLATPELSSVAFNIENSTQVHEWTGRKAWTETIIAHIQESVPGFREQNLLGLKKAKMFGDVCVLPIQAFGSGQLKYKNSPDSTSEGVMVKHFMMHLWQ